MLARGTVTIPRRPVGWVAPGPAPSPPDRPEIWPASGEVLCHLVGDWRILQRSDGHRWSLDDLVTAWAAGRACRSEPPRSVADLGCGIGSVLLMLAWRFPAARCVGLEAQDAAVALARRSAAWNGVDGRCEVRRIDLRDVAAVEEPPFDLVTGTPPYLPPGTASEPRRFGQAGCHLELRGGIEEYCAAASRITSSGRFVVCHSDVARTERAALAAGFAVAERLDVIPRAGKRRLFSVFVLERRARTPGVTTLVVRDGCGRWTAEFRALRDEMGMPS